MFASEGGFPFAGLMKESTGDWQGGLVITEAQIDK